MNINEFNKQFRVISLKSLLETLGSKNQVRKVLKTFTCTLNKDLENFLHHKAITFEENLRARTYLCLSNIDQSLVAYYTISISAISAKKLDKDTLEFLNGYSDDIEIIPCYLIGQLGISDKYREYKLGKFILGYAIETIENIHSILGGRFILLDAINHQKVIDFYKENDFLEIKYTNNQESISMVKPFFTTKS